ncbi:OapC/ArvC family zinc-ribbon domain-containing protein [Halorubrum aidingense]|uniref:OapC/ArvC family zinc-ribbon domain-containing protein n=1 Tax=Halorubrum aidingense TaxID=368623 RepID=UPI0006779724|nr:Zn-ribbon containing protein [Halorubrum aidingense]
MPHQCTTCGRTFRDGSKEMLSGCPDCGGNKFQFKPKGTSADEEPSPPDATPSAPASSPSETPSASSPSETPSAPSPPETPSASSGTAAPGEPTDPTGPADPPASAEPRESTQAGSTERVSERTGEDTAQASARSDVVSPDELDRASRDVDPDAGPGSDSTSAEEGPRPDIGELRDELNEQFESIRIVSPGKYELNLMELYDRQEYIISLQEDGRYVIEMPDAWGISDE